MSSVEIYLPHLLCCVDKSKGCQIPPQIQKNMNNKWSEAVLENEKGLKKTYQVYFSSVPLTMVGRTDRKGDG